MSTHTVHDICPINCLPLFPYTLFYPKCNHMHKYIAPNVTSAASQNIHIYDEANYCWAGCNYIGAPLGFRCVSPLNMGTSNLKAKHIDTNPHLNSVKCHGAQGNKIALISKLMTSI